MLYTKTVRPCTMFMLLKAGTKAQIVTATLVLLLCAKCMTPCVGTLTGVSHHSAGATQTNVYVQGSGLQCR